MALDRTRNALYAEALRAVITPKSVVLDLGAGLGIHGVIAARLGARRVYLVEQEDVISVAEEIARASGVADVVRCVRGRFEEARIEEPVDVIVSALTGNFLLTEDLLPVLLRARDSVLKPGGVLLPSAARMEIVPVSAPDLHAREVGAWSNPQHGVELSPARPYAANTVHYGWDRTEVTYLAEPATIHVMNFRTDAYDDLHAEAVFTALTSGVCHGFAGWFSMQLGERWVSTAPHAEPLHWSAAFLPLDPPVTLRSGETLGLRLDRAAHGDWTWRVTHDAGSQRHSTMLSEPLTAETLRKAAPDYAPRLRPDGEAAAYVLSRCDGATQVATIAGEVHQRWPSVCETLPDATRFVRQLVKRLA